MLIDFPGEIQVCTKKFYFKTFHWSWYHRSYGQGFVLSQVKLDIPFALAAVPVVRACDLLWTDVPA